MSTVPFPLDAPPSPPPSAQPGKKFAKTLRLTSDQLVNYDAPSILNPIVSSVFDYQKALGLKKGANSITFSLSASGQVACTARIFVWDSKDYVVVSDIDGTITKYIFP